MKSFGFFWLNRLNPLYDKNYVYAAADEAGQNQNFLAIANSRVFNNIDPVVRASVAGAQPAPVAYLTVISGTNQLTSIDLPWLGFTGTIAFRPTGAFTGATGGTSTSSTGAIGLAFTAVVGKILLMTYDGALWYPSYVS
jgi:hypothetical protein